MGDPAPTLVPVQPASPLPPTGTTIGFALSLLAGVVVAPFGEEILFRGFATTAWVRGRGVVARACSWVRSCSPSRTS